MKIIDPALRTEVLVNGFDKELKARMSTIESNRVELERLYAMRVDDGKLDESENSKYKEDAMKAIRNAESAFTSYAGSVRSITGVIVT